MRRTSWPQLSMTPPGHQASAPTHTVATSIDQQDASYLIDVEQELRRSMPGQVERSTLFDKSNSTQSFVQDEGFSSLMSKGNQYSRSYDDSSQSWSAYSSTPSHRRKQTSSSAREGTTGAIRAEEEAASMNATSAAPYSMASPLSSPDEERPTSFLLASAAPPGGLASNANAEGMDLQHSRTRLRSDNSQLLGGGGGGDTISTSSHAHNQFPFLPYTGTLPRHRSEQQISLPGRTHDIAQPVPSSRPGGTSHPEQPGQASTDLQPLMPLVFQPSLNLVMLNYNSIWARIHHFLYTLFYFAHIPVTLFFDYSVLYALIQIALHPSSNPTTDSGNVRANPWWVAVGFYALCILVWLGVILIYEVYYCYIPVWKQGHPSIMSIYLRPSAFHLCSMRSFSHYSFLWRIRLGAFTGIGSIPPNYRDGVIELCYSFMQNWPTIVTVIPRAAASLLLLLSFTPAHREEPLPSEDRFGRDDLYFKSDGMLTRYAAGVNLAHFSWALFRTLLLVVASLIYWFLTRRYGPSLPSLISEEYRDAYTRTSWAPSFASTTPLRLITWKDRLRLRILEAVLLSSSRERWRAAIERREKSNARRRRLSRNSMNEGRRSSKFFAGKETKRKSIVVQAPEMMQERSAALQITPAPYTGPFSTQENGQAVIEHVPQSYTPPTPCEEALPNRRDLPDRPSSSLGFNPPAALNTHRQVEIVEDNSSEDDGFEDENEAERIAWNQHPPLSPRGSLILARQDLSQQQQEADSYWNTAPTSQQQQQQQQSQDNRNGNSFEISRERILGDIIEESEEEASLRRANSNRRSMSSRQSSLMRPSSALDRLERAINEGQAE